MKLSPMKAIAAKCRDCNYDPLDTGTWTQQIESCTSTDCALWEHRPVTGATKAERKAERIAAMSPEELAAYQAKVEAARERIKQWQK
jgi:hypothetical protein